MKVTAGKGYYCLCEFRLITGTSDRGRLDSLVSELGGAYNVTNLGTVNHLLGISVCCTEKGIHLDQAAYLRSTLEEAGTALTPRSTPWDSRANEDDLGEALDAKGAQRYRRLLGKVMYAANCTRPDICFAVSNLSRSLQEPKALHWRRLIRLLQYLASTPTLGLFYRRETGSCKVITYADAALGDDQSQGRGRSGIIVKLGGGPVSWGSHIQPAVTASSQAAELLAVHGAAQATLKISNLLEELGCKDRGPPVILEDNDGARAMIMGNEIAARTDPSDT